MKLLFTAPSVAYQLILNSGKDLIIQSPSEFPDRHKISKILEPYAQLEVLTPVEYLGAVMDLNAQHRSILLEMSYMSEVLVNLTYKVFVLIIVFDEILFCLVVILFALLAHFCAIFAGLQIPLAEIISSYHDRLKSCSKGYAHMSYFEIGYSAGDLVRLDILINDELLPAMATIVPRERARFIGAAICDKLRELIHKEHFKVTIGNIVSFTDDCMMWQCCCALLRDILNKHGYYRGCNSGTAIHRCAYKRWWKTNRLHLLIYQL
jgi:GTP-binding protein LepA